MAAGVDWLEPDNGERPPNAPGDPAVSPGGPRWGRRALIAVGGVLVVTAAVRTWPDSSSTPVRPTTAPSSSSGPDVPHEVGAQSVEQSTVSQVTALAVHRGPVTEFVRQTSAAGSCPLVRPGRSPAHDIAAAVRAVLPDVRLVTIGRTLDQFTGLCSLQLRGTVPPRRTVQSSGPPARAVVVMNVAAPPPSQASTGADRIRTGKAVDGATTTSFVSAQLRTGWTVLIGARGDASRLPSEEQLLTLAAEPALTWAG